MQAVKRIFLILNTLAAYPEGMSLSELSTAISLAKSTTSRFLHSLEEVNAVARTNNHYTLGFGIASLAVTVPNRTLVQALAYPTLIELANSSKETVHLGVRKGRTLRYIEQLNTPHRVQLDTWLDQTYPLHLTAAGKVFLAHADEAFLCDYLSRGLEAFSANSITDPHTLKEELRHIKTAGYARTQREFSTDISGFAVGIFNSSAAPIASISISGTAFRFPGGNETKIISLLLNASQQLSRKVGKERVSRQR